VKLRLLASALVLAPLVARGASPQVPALPAGAETRWIVQKPEEIVAYVVFDPATVAGGPGSESRRPDHSPSGSRDKPLGFS